MVRFPWMKRRRRAVDGDEQQQALGCAVVTGRAPPLVRAGVAALFRVCTAWHAKSQIWWRRSRWISHAARAVMGWMDGRESEVLALGW